MRQSFLKKPVVKSVAFWSGLAMFWATSGESTAATFVVTSVNNSGEGSLRQAIIDANVNPGLDRIEFSIAGNGPFVIRPLTALPPLTDPVVVDGTTQLGPNGVPGVEIDGSNVSGDGLQILGGNSVVLGLAITHCNRDGIRLTGPRGTNLIAGNYIGLSIGGAAGGNGNAGITIYRSQGNVIGGSSPSARNVVSGGNPIGIFVVDAAARNNRICGNYIGVSADGSQSVGNDTYGIEVLGGAANMIGGLEAGAGNVISGNGLYGVLVANRTTTGGAPGTSATNNLIVGNFIGTDASGSRSLGNKAHGVFIQGAAGNQVGGASAGARNVISGNKQYGLIIAQPGSSNNWVQGNYVGLAADGTSGLSNGLSGMIIDGPGNGLGGTNAGAGNVASGNGEYGIYLGPNSGNCVVQGNYIGTDSTGSKAVGNVKTGLRAESPANQIGGSAPGAGNVFSGNSNSGLYIYGAAASNNVVQGNCIGLGMDGLIVSNAWYGISISNAPGTLIGGAGVGARNIVSGNGYSGVTLTGTNATGTRVLGNYIGTDSTGLKNRGNGDCGIFLQFSPSNTIGGVGVGNLISASVVDGIRLEEKQSSGNLIVGNYIGTDVTGSNRLGNGGCGVILSGAPFNTVGGNVTGAGNLISANSSDGIQVIDSGANSNIVQGNWIGTKVDGTSALGNGAYGIELANTAAGNLIGGSVPEADNHIAFNGRIGGGYDGIRVRADCVGNFISRNSIFSNNLFGLYNSLGIDYGNDGVSANGLPVLTSATSGAQTVVAGSIKATANSAYLIQFYSSPTTNVAGYGEGMFYVGSQTATTDGTGAAAFTATLSILVAPGQFVTATATDPAGTTTEFSRGVLVAATAGAGAIPLANAAVLGSVPPQLPQGVASSPSAVASLPSPRTIRPTTATPAAVLPAANPLAFLTQESFQYTQPELIALRTNGAASNRLNVVFFPEGYTTNELGQFLADAQRAADGLLSAPPYLEYRDYCNIYAIVVPSEQSGTSHPQWPLMRNTYFNTSYDPSLDYILAMPPNEVDTNYANGRGKIDALLQTFMPRCGLPIVIVNDIVPGGSGGGVCIASLSEPFPELMVHESGHTLSHLGDEYTASRDYAGSLDADTEPNTTKETRRNYIKWKSWIDASTPVPTPELAQYDAVDGLFQGAHYNALGWYRPQMDCIMRQMDSGAPFCDVCAEAQVKAFYQYARPIDSTSPLGDLAFVPSGQSRTFTVTPLQPLTHNLSIQWSLDGTPIPGATNPACQIGWAAVTGRSATLTATVSDPTPLVRNDPSNVLQQTFSWTVAPEGFPVAATVVASPANQSVRFGSNATLTVVAHGSEPLFYQWRHAGVDLAGATGPTLDLNAAQVSDAGAYSVTVSNEFGHASSTTAVVTVTVPVKVQIVGSGSAAPNYDGQWLDYGKSYTMTALPASRCIFSNWSGGASTNKPKLTFTASPGLSLTASFIDPVRPTLSVTAPTEHARLTNDVVNIKGIAGDNAGVSTVRYRLNGGSWIDAQSVNHWTNWTAPVSVPAGSNVIEANSIDSFGNLSASVVRHFTRVVMQPLTVVKTSGNGTFSPDLNGKPLELGKPYAITAVPGKGQLFAGWSTGERAAALKFQMSTNLVLQAGFVTNPFTGLKGVYNGLFEAAGNTNVESSGFIKLTVTDQGAFTGTLLGPSTINFSGKFWIDGTAQVTVMHLGKPVVVNLGLDIVNGSGQILGQVSSGTWTADFRCDLAQPGGAAPGLYTMAVLSEGQGQSFGDGIGSVKIDALGGLRLTGTLADGTGISQSTSVSKSGLWPFYAKLYGGKGAIVGWITFTNTGLESLSGTGSWIKTPVRGVYYPGGFTNAVTITGSTFQPVKSGTRILDLTNGNVVISGANVAVPLSNSIALASNNVVTVTAGTNSLKLGVGTATGLFSSTFINPATRATTPLHGVLLQQSAGARGFFLSGTNGGAFLLEPAEQRP